MATDQLQFVRLIDVFALGPVMIAAGMRKPFRNPLLDGFLLVSGVATIVFNGKRFLDGAP